VLGLFLLSLADFHAHILLRRTCPDAVRVVAGLCRWVFEGRPVGWSQNEHMQTAIIGGARVVQERTVLDLIFIRRA
jgi:hypothetical protein